MSDFINRIKEVASVEDLAREHTVLTVHGRRLRGYCPFHDDKEPSFDVYPDQNRWHCYGCGEGGSVIDFVMKRYACDVWTAAITLAARYDIPIPRWTDKEKAEDGRRQKIETIRSHYVEACHIDLHNHPDALDYLTSRGITHESIETYQIGIGLPIPDRVNRDLADAAGITEPRLVGRILIPVLRGGKIVQLYARTLRNEKPKYLALKDRIFPFNAQRLQSEKVVFVEGPIDAIMLEQAGIPACATTTIFKPDWLRLVGKKTSCYACYDTDDDGTGAKATDDICTQLLKAGHKAFVIQLPPGYDPASFIQKEGADAFRELMAKSKPFLDHIIERIPNELDIYGQQEALNNVYEKMTALPKESLESYFQKISSHLGFGKEVIRSGFKDHLELSKKQESTKPVKGDELKIKRRESNPTFISPAQDFIGGVLYYTIYFEVDETDEMRPFVVTSKRECFPLSAEAFHQRGLIWKGKVQPSNYGRWSIGTDYPCNAHSFLDGKTHVDPKELYREIKAYFTRYLRLPNPLYYDFLACWVIGTYHFRLYDSFGYLYVNAMKGSGKTILLSLVQQFAFNASMSDAVTEAVLKRRVSADAATIIADEAEYYSRKLRDEKSMIFEVFNGGYKRTGKASMVDSETKSVEDYATYSPKALANTEGLYDILRDRCISMYLLRSSEKIPQFVEAERKEPIQQIRDKLYCFTLENIQDIDRTRRDLNQPDDLPGRDWELWQGVLTIATYLDRFGVVETEPYEMADGTVRVLGSLYERVHTMAVERRNYRIALEEDTRFEPRVMLAIWQYVTENHKQDELYSTSELCRHIQDELDVEYFTTKKLSQFVFDTVAIANRRMDKREHWHVNFEGKRVKNRMIRIRKDVLIKRARELFSLELDDKDKSEIKRNPFEEE